MSEETIQGLPGCVLLPSRLYNFKLLQDDVSIEIPISGDFKTWYPDINTDHPTKFHCVGTEDDSIGLSMLMLTDVLVASEKYPDLKDGQVFTIKAVIIDYTLNTLVIEGLILEFCPVKEDNENE